MKVVQINCSSGGSTGNIAKSIHEKVIEQGNESYIFFGGGKGDDSNNIIPILPKFFIRIHSFLSRITGYQGYFSSAYTRRLIKKIKKMEPDIIHLHNLHGSYLCLPILFRFLKRYNKKTIITLHDCWLFTGKCSHFTRVNCDKWKVECGNCPQLASYPKSLFFDRSKRLLEDKKVWLSNFENIKIIAVSNWLRDTAKMSFLSQYSIQTIYNGVDECVFYPRESRELKNKYKLGDKFVVLGVAPAWTSEKGLDDFYKLASMLSKDEIIVLVGMTSSQIEKLPTNIIGIQRTENREELSELYSMADVFVQTSLEETFGLVTAEALACGTPAVVYNSTACAEIVDENCGYIAVPKNIKQVYDFIQQEKKNPLKGKFKKIFSKNEMVDNYMRIYGEDCCKKK